MTEEATRIEDLPDHPELEMDDASRIVQTMNEQQDFDEVSEIDVQEKPKKKKDSVQYFDSGDMMEKLKQSAVVFVLVFALSQPQVASVMMYIPYLKKLQPNSMMFNAVIALLSAIIYFVVMYSIDILY